MPLNDPFSNNPFSGFFEEDPEGQRALFFGQPGVRGLPQNSVAQGFIGNQLFNQANNKFLSALGQQFLGGGVPTLTRRDFFSNPDNFNARREFLRAPGFQTGRSTSGLLSTGRFLLQR
jgi:hypothetical protein